jgi:RNA polymerase sigma-70 factor, ECF subfamily
VILPVTRPAPVTAFQFDELTELKRRDTAAWSALFEREHPVIFRSVLSQVGNRAVAEDITAQVFVEAIEGIERYRDRGRPIVAWLFSIARFRCADWFRRRGRESVLEDAPEPAVDGPDASLTVALAALSELTPEQREVIHLRFVEGRPLEEVGQMTGRSAGAVKALQHRALARLKNILERDPEARIR